MKMEQNIINIPIEDIIPNRFQPRLAFEENGLKELSDSIKQHGIIQPLVLRRLGDKYEIIAGERRYKAATMAGLQTVPAVISNIDDNQSAEVALVENIQRRNLTAIEEAKSYRNLLDRGYLTQEQLAEKMGVSQSSVANKLRLLNLHSEVQEALLNEKISERHARSLLAIPMDEQVSWLKRIIDQRMTVRQLDVEIKKYRDGDSSEDDSLIYTPNIDHLVATAKDISEITSINMEQPITSPPIEPAAIEPTKMPNKFFNFLEDEETNMEISEPIKMPELINITPTIDSIDDLDELDEAKTPTIENNFPDFPINNTIEEKEIEKEEEDLIDPTSYIDLLDPNYKENQVKASGLDLKTSINMVREKVNQMKNIGFDINVEEIDLTDSYQITIEIKK